jgi:hypothetical protein
VNDELRKLAEEGGFADQGEGWIVLVFASQDGTLEVRPAGTMESARKSKELMEAEGFVLRMKMFGRLFVAF